MFKIYIWWIPTQRIKKPLSEWIPLQTNSGEWFSKSIMVSILQMLGTVHLQKLCMYICSYVSYVTLRVIAFLSEECHHKSLAHCLVEILRHIGTVGVQMLMVIVDTWGTFPVLILSSESWRYNYTSWILQSMCKHFTVCVIAWASQHECLANHSGGLQKSCFQSRLLHAMFTINMLITCMGSDTDTYGMKYTYSPTAAFLLHSLFDFYPAHLLPRASVFLSESHKSKLEVRKADKTSWLFADV